MHYLHHSLNILIFFSALVIELKTLFLFNGGRCAALQNGAEHGARSLHTALLASPGSPQGPRAGARPDVDPTLGHRLLRVTQKPRGQVPIPPGLSCSERHALPAMWPSPISSSQNQHRDQAEPRSPRDCDGWRRTWASLSALGAPAGPQLNPWKSP